MCRRNLRRNTNLHKYAILTSVVAFISVITFGQTPGQADGKLGIQKATELVQGYFSAGITLLYVIGAVIGLVGAIKVYNKWSSGEQDAQKSAAAWFGACIFLVIVATVLQSFFGVRA